MIFTDGLVTMSRADTLQAIIDRDGDYCRVPGCKDRSTFTETNPRTIEHVIPRARGGIDDMSNLELAHQRCNNVKGDRMYIGVDENGERVLEPLPYREPRSTVVKRPPTDCCNEGRDLGKDEVCPVCDAVPQPYNFPQWAKLTPKECPHSGPWWCWADMIGLYERVPASSDVFGATDDA